MNSSLIWHKKRYQHNAHLQVDQLPKLGVRDGHLRPSAEPRDPLSLFVADADTADIVEDLWLPGDVLGHAAQWAAAGVRDRGAARVQIARREAVRTLLEAGFTLRDAGEVLGLSYQRVHQLAG